MNAPLGSSHLLPEIHPRAMPEALLEALRQRFVAQFSTALVVREEQGRNDSGISVRPPDAVV